MEHRHEHLFPDLHESPYGKREKSESQEEPFETCPMRHKCYQAFLDRLRKEHALPYGVLDKIENPNFLDQHRKEYPPPSRKRLEES